MLPAQFFTFISEATVKIREVLDKIDGGRPVGPPGILSDISIFPVHTKGSPGVDGGTLELNETPIVLKKQEGGLFKAGGLLVPALFVLGAVVILRGFK